MNFTKWTLFLDDLRDPPKDKFCVVCRSSKEAIAAVREYGMPYLMLLDHDLGGDDTAMKFLTILANDLWNTDDRIPDYDVHSMNPIGKCNIIAFMQSWYRAVKLDE